MVRLFLQVLNSFTQLYRKQPSRLLTDNIRYLVFGLTRTKSGNLVHCRFNPHPEYMQELTEAKDQVKVEQKRVFQLEVKLAEANEKLDQVAELEKQLTHYRQALIPKT